MGGVSASDVVDMSNNPDNNNLVSDSVSQESIGNYYTDQQLSNEEVSSLNSQDLEVSSSDLLVEDDSKAKSTSSSTSSTSSSSSTATSSTSSGTSSDSTKNTDSASAKTKNATELTISNKTVYSGNSLVITLKDKNGKLLKGKKVVLNITGFKQTYTKTSDSNGQVKLVVTPVGSYKAVFSFAGDGNYAASKLSTTIKILKSKTSFEIKSTNVPRTTHLIVTLKNSMSGKALANKKVTFKIPKWHNKVYTRKTNSDGIAKLKINTDQKIKVIIGFAGDSNLNKTSVTKTVKPTKCVTKIAHIVRLQYGKSFCVALRNSENEGISGQMLTVKIPVLKKTFTKKTNSQGKIYIPISKKCTFNMIAKFSGDKFFNSSSASGNCTVVKGATTITAPKEAELGSKYIITIKNAAGKELANKKLVIKINNKTYNKNTNSKGQVSFNLNLKKGTYPVEVSFAGDSNYNSSNVSHKFKVVDPAVSISKIVKAAQELKTRAEYINLLNKSYSVSIDNKKFTLDEFAYLMAGAISHIKSGSKAKVTIKDLPNTYKSSGAKINGKLSKSEYLKLAANVTKYADSKKNIPNNSPTNLGKMEADLYIYAFTSVLSSYGKNKKLPSSVSVKTNNVRGGYSYAISQGGKLLNCREIFDPDTFAKYLKTGGSSALNTAIKNKAKAITAGLSSPLAKAVAIFRFVRDDVTYSFYSNSRKGAAKTLSTRSGNCCDKANLIVAMCRSVGVYARYSHAQGCKFQSGLYTGHVWAQVYDPATQTWYSADATSFRNEVGNIKNWNTKSHYRDKNYALIPF